MDSQENFLNPERIIGALHIPKGGVIADFGAGHGYFTIPLARATGPEGKVYAIDIQKAGLNIIRAKARLEHLPHLELIWSDLDRPNGSKLKDESMNLVFIANILFQSEKKEVILHEAHRVLKPGGQAIVIEWKPGEIPFGPPQVLRVSAETIEKAAAHEGFAFDRELPVGTHHYGLIFKK